ncbi:MAG: SET domain-containing protein-lysine N-methyltransferase [Actinomycetales bacterium]|nr:SET domain-containing protein-lysine N-methyltransferase [Actinomycetales bacterium]
MNVNWLTSSAQASDAGEKGMGSYATAAIAKGETVVGFGGSVTTREILNTLTEDQQHRSIQVAQDLYLSPTVNREPGDMINHSCDPNLGLLGSMVLVAMRDIKVGEELTFDYATCDDSDYDEFDCLCGADVCRGRVTGQDWKLPELQAKYAGWFSPYIAQKIAESV